jgi:hypothetical protein
MALTEFQRSICRLIARPTLTKSKPISVNSRNSRIKTRSEALPC